MSDYETGYRKPPKNNRFKSGECPNKAGRPKKRRRLLLPRQLREDFFRVMEEVVTVETPAGRKKMTTQELILRSMARKASMGNATAMRMCVELMISSLNDRVEANGPVRLLDHIIDQENRAEARVHEMLTDPDYDIVDATKNIY